MFYRSWTRPTERLEDGGGGGGGGARGGGGDATHRDRNGNRDIV